MSELLPIDQLCLAELKERGGAANQNELWHGMRAQLVAERPNKSVSRLFFQRAIDRLVSSRLVQRDAERVWLVSPAKEIGG